MLTLLVVLERHGHGPPVGHLRPQRLLRLPCLLLPGLRFLQAAGDVPRLRSPAGLQLPQRLLRLPLLLQGEGTQRDSIPLR